MSRQSIPLEEPSFGGVTFGVAPLFTSMAPPFGDVLGLPSALIAILRRRPWPPSAETSFVGGALVLRAEERSLSDAHGHRR